MEKITLPTRTKIAAWWMVATGGISLLAFLFAVMLLLLFFLSAGGSGANISSALFLGSLLLTTGASFFGILFFFFPGILILKRRKWAWKLAIKILSLGLIIVIGLIGLITLFGFELEGRLPHFSEFISGYKFFAAPLVLLLFPFVLLLVDRKNIFEFLDRHEE